MEATHDPVPFRFSSTSTRSSSLAGPSSNASLVEICDSWGMLRNRRCRRALSEAIMHAKRIAEIVAGLNGRQAFRRANTSESGAMRVLSEATALFTMAQ